MNEIRLLHDALLEQIDPEKGGIRWMDGQLDWKRKCLLGEYLIASASGVLQALTSAKFVISEYKKSVYSENTWLTTQWAAIGRDGNSRTDDFLAASSLRSPVAEARDLRLRFYPESCIVHLVQALDRLAAVIAVTAACRVKVLKVDWIDITAIAEKGSNRGRPEYLQPEAGRLLQDRLYSTILRSPEEAGPKDWLSWMVSARNTIVHRAPKMRWYLLTVNRSNRPDGLTSPFPRQPGWGEVEAMMEKGVAGPMKMLLNDRPESTLEGLLGSTCAVVSEISSVLLEILAARSADPNVIVQNGGQWADPFTEELLSFEGYGDPPKLQPESEISIHIAPETSRRMDAARIGDKWIQHWHGGESLPT